MPQKLILKQFQSPGDIVMLTAAVRDLHRCYPDRFLTDVRTSSDALWEHNPFLTPLREDDPDVRVIECQYPLIHRSNQAPYHFIHGFTAFLNDELGLAVKPTEFKGDIHISEEEKSWISQIEEITGEQTPFWIVCCGGKSDFTIKWWDVARYQRVVDHFTGRIRFVQIGSREHYHPALDHVIDLRGKTDLRQLVRLVYHSRGVVGPVSLAMHLAAAVPCPDGQNQTRPCVVIAGGREPSHWEAYPHHQYLHTIGALSCCMQGGCWKSRTLPLGDGDDKDLPENLCVDVVDNLPRCMDLISAEDVIAKIELYLGTNYFTSLRHETRKEAERVTMEKQNLPAERLDDHNALLHANAYIAGMDEYPGGFKGRGIIMCAGGVKYFTPAWVGINILRQLGCSLPIQLWYLGPEEMSEHMRALVKPLNVECIDGLALREEIPCRILNGWELKPYAILNSRFKEVLFIDADNFPLRNPEFLFECNEYRDHGAIMWPDLGKLEKDREIWSLCGIEYRDEPEVESGQLVFDKERCWKALKLCMWYNEYSDFFYRHVHGDKETFHLAFRKMNKSYAMPETPVHLLDGVYCQHDFQGERLFQHRNGAKWEFSGDNKKIAGFELEQDSFKYLDQLRKLWNGSVSAEKSPAKTDVGTVPDTSTQVNSTHWDTLDSLPRFVRKVLAEADPLSQNVSEDNLGFGWIYYSMVKNLRPDFVVAIGSKMGFMPFCAARALRENNNGKLIFIDPSYEGEGHPGWSGTGQWSNPEAVSQRIADYGLSSCMTHLKKTSRDAFEDVKSMVADKGLGLVIIDGAHTYENSLEDFDLYSSLVNPGGFVLFHDATNTACGVSRTIATLKGRRIPVVVLDREAGLALVEIGHIPTVENHWDYLCRPSNRGELLFGALKELLQPGDTILDVYCGYSPIAPFIQEQKLVGWDQDLSVIQRLTEEFPAHDWFQIEEQALPFADMLPDEIDVLAGFGLVNGRAAWDPQYVTENMRYLLGRYHPRCCFFSAAADYYDADILDEILNVYRPFGYRHRFIKVDTDLDSFSLRKVLILER